MAAALAAVALLAPSGASAGPASTAFEIRVDLRSDRGYAHPIAEVRRPDGGIVAPLDCLDDGTGPDSVAGDRLFVCRGAAAGSGDGALVLLADAGGASAALEVDRLVFSFVSGRTVRWTWRPSRSAPRGSGAEGPAIAADAAADLLGQTGPSAVAESAGRGAPAKLVGGALVRPIDAVDVDIPEATVPPPWWAWLALPGCAAVLAAARALYAVAFGALLRRAR